MCGGFWAKGAVWDIWTDRDIEDVQKSTYYSAAANSAQLQMCIRDRCKTVGQYKVDVTAERIKDINPDAVVRTYKTCLLYTSRCV